MQRFGFVIHPISVRKDMARKYPVARLLPDPAVEWIIAHVPPRLVSHITGIRSLTGVEAEGWFSGCPLTPRQFLTLDPEFVYRKIVAAVRLAADAGARIVGLGAYTSVAGDGGVTVSQRAGVAITTGNSFTCYTAVEGARRGAELMGVSPATARVAIVGATGSIGRVCAHLLADDGVGEMLLLGRDAARLAAVREELPGSGSVRVSTDLDADLPTADIIVTVTSAVDAVVHPDHLKPGAVVCDVSRPRDVSVRVAAERPDVLVVEGGVVAVPGDVDFHFNFGFPPRTAYACMAETMILALSDRYEHFSIGKDLELSRVREISRLAAQHGFTLAGMRSFEKAVTDEDIARIRAAADDRRNAPA